MEAYSFTLHQKKKKKRRKDKENLKPNKQQFSAKNTLYLDLQVSFVQEC